MITLSNGTVIRNEQDLRDFLEPLGFDCWKWQRQDIAEMIIGISMTDIPSSEQEYAQALDEIGNQIDSVSILLSSAAEQLGNDIDAEDLDEVHNILRAARSDIENIVEQCQQIDLTF